MTDGDKWLLEYLECKLMEFVFITNMDSIDVLKPSQDYQHHERLPKQRFIYIRLLRKYHRLVNKYNRLE